MKNSKSTDLWVTREIIEDIFKSTVNATPEWQGTHGLHCEIGDYTLSLQWHRGAYSDNRGYSLDEMYDVDLCENFEIGLWHSRTQEWVPCSNFDDVQGFVSWKRLSHILSVVARPDLHGSLPYVCAFDNFSQN